MFAYLHMAKLEQGKPSPWYKLIDLPKHLQNLEEVLLLIILFSMLQMGPKQITAESQGVNYRALSDLFHISEQRKDAFTYEISVQMMEIYNEQVRDLLASDGNRRYPLSICSEYSFSFALIVHMTNTNVCVLHL